MKKVSRFIINFLIIIVAIILVCSVFYVISYYQEAQEEGQEYSNLQEQYGTVETPPIVIPPVLLEDIKKEEVEEIVEIKPSYTYDWDSLSTINGDVSHWIYVPDSYIDYPVVLGSDNSYYLKHSFEKAYNNNGCPFFDCNTDLENDDVWIIYGHNMIGNSTKLLRTVMFSSLILWLEEDYFNAHPTIYLTDNENNTHTFEILAVDLMNVYDGNKSFDYIKHNFETEDEFNSYIDGIYQFANVSSDIEPLYGERLLVLSTCYRPLNNGGGRLVVFAVEK